MKQGKLSNIFNGCWFKTLNTTKLQKFSESPCIILVLHQSICDLFDVVYKFVNKFNYSFKDDKPVFVLESISVFCPDVDNFYKTYLNGVNLFLGNKVIDQSVREYLDFETKVRGSQMLKEFFLL